MISRADVRFALARGYSAPVNANKPVDINLLEAQTDEVMELIDKAVRRKLELSKQGGSTQ